MKTLLINGSARKKGFTTKMANTLLDHLSGEKEVIQVYEKNVKPCKDCRYCWKHKACSIQDDMQEIYKKIDESDVIIFANPMYFHSVSGPLKTVIDRFQVYWAEVKRGDEKQGKQKIGAILLCGGAPDFPKQFLGAEIVLEHVLDTVQARSIGEVTITNTDNVVFEKEIRVIENIRLLADSITTEYLNNLPH